MTLTLGIVGAGNIAAPYLEDLQDDPNLSVKGITDVSVEKAQTLADSYGLQVYEDLDALLADNAIDLVVNLTIHHAHYAVTKQCLNAGKHVYSEKPLALNYTEAKELVDLAEAEGLRLGAAPFTFLYETHQVAWNYVRAGKLGEVRLVYADANWGRMETWHPDPAPYYEVGPLADVGVYPLTFLTALFGPVREVTALTRTLKPKRETLGGESFALHDPDFWLCLLEHTSGVTTRLTANFYVTHSSQQESGIEIHGDDRSLFISSWLWPNGTVEIAEFNEPYEKLPLEQTFGEKEIHWGIGVRDMVSSMLRNEPHRTTGAHAAHIVEVLDAARASAEAGKPVQINPDWQGIA